MKKVVLKIVILSLLAFLIGFYHVSQKENLDIDETYTYGLANSSFQLDIEDFKEYTGEELLKSYAMVKDGKEFDIANVFFNQKMDTHPPLYYMLVNFICSIKKNTFSMWYGLIINVILLVALFWEMRYLFSLIIKDKLFSSILTLLSFFLYGFTNEIVFTRMYVMLTVISMAFVILIINKIKTIDSTASYTTNAQTNTSHTDYTPMTSGTGARVPISDIYFLLIYFFLCVIGMLTQYHFAFIAGFFSLILAITLIKKKNFPLLIATFITGVLSIGVSILIFPGMLTHFFGKNSLHALTNTQSTPLPTKFLEIITTIHTAFFGNVGLFIFLGILAILIIISIFIKKNVKNIFAYPEFKIYIWFLLCSIYYYVLISITCQFTFMRYLYNIYPLLTIILFSPIYLVLKNIAPSLKIISIILMITLCITSNAKSQADSLNIGDELFHQFLLQNNETKTILLYRSIDSNGNMNSMGTTSKWKLPYPLYLFRDMKNMTFVDIGYDRKLSMSESPSIMGHNDIFLVIYTTETDEYLINQIMQKNNVTRADKMYFTNYIHVYRLH